MKVEDILRKSASGKIALIDFERFSIEEGLAIEDSFNRVSLLIASKFDSGEMSYDEGDCAMNNIWPIMLDYIVSKGMQLVEPCYQIYSAFDAGEFGNGDDYDAVERNTIPAIKEILKDASKL